MDLQRISNRWRRLVHGRHVHIWHDSAYRLPISGLDGGTGFEPRRADLVLWFLADCWVMDEHMVRHPRKARYRELARVHTPELLESLTHPRTLARIFAVDESDVQVDELLSTIRLACGATLQAARECYRHGSSIALNLFGGFHHAGPDQAGGFCAINDIAVAIADLRALGCTDPIAVLDLDAHPPDGLAACLHRDPQVWIGSLSGEDWGPLDGVDETVLARGCGDREYLRALRALLDRMPPARFAFVIAGGDVLAEDRLGKLALTLQGVRERDLAIVRALGGIPQVWTPGGGYTARAWRSLAGTALAIACRSRDPIPTDYDPMRARFGKLAARLNREQLEGGSDLSAADLEEALGLRPPQAPRLLGFYTREGVEHALSHYGLLPHIRRLGYEKLRVDTALVALGDAVRLYGTSDQREHLLLECVLERKRSGERAFLYVHWLTLRNPKAHFSRRRPQLPGQDAPGLGLAREIGWLLARIGKRLGLDGVAYRPAWYHTAYSGRYHFVFRDSVRQGRFEAMLRDFRDVPLLEVTHAAAEGRVRMNGEPYSWEADEMVFWLVPGSIDEEAIAAERERVRFTIVPERGLQGSPEADCGKDEGL